MMKLITALLLVLFHVCEVSHAFQAPISPLTSLPSVQTKRRLISTVSHQPAPLTGSTGVLSPLFSSSEGGNDSSNRRNPFKIFRKISSRLSTRFSSLSKRAKTIVVVQMMIVTLLFGGFARNAQTRRTTAPVELPFSQFMDIVENRGSSTTAKGGGNEDLHILDLKIGSDRIGFQIARGTTQEQIKALKEYKEGKNPSVPIPSRPAFTRKVSASPELIDYLRRNQTPFRAATAVSNASLLAMSARGLLLTFYLLYMWRIMKQMSGGGGGSPGKLADLSELPLATFSDIQGIDSAKFEVMELVDTLRNPDKYAILGARAPKGLLLEGPPGTGKTLLARATASTAGVPLLYCSGSDFVEMFVGRGAARVRKTFEKAEKLAPCLIFIDELDALGKSRDTGTMAGMGRGNDEAEQTLNQLLACMDGLDSKGKQICVMAATNRREVLDSALLRPGRFDRIVRLELPDAEGRENILRVHAKKLPGFKECTGVDETSNFGMGDAVDLSTIALATPGLSGAELEFIVNESAIRAVRRVSAALRDDAVDPKSITPNVRPDDFEDAVRTFYSSRKKSGASGAMSDILNNVWK